jgi:hypothetical protein
MSEGTGNGGIEGDNVHKYSRYEDGVTLTTDTKCRGQDPVGDTPHVLPPKHLKACAEDNVSLHYANNHPLTSSKLSYLTHKDSGEINDTVDRNISMQ